MCSINMLLEHLMVSDAVMCFIIMKPFFLIFRVLIVGLCECELMGLNMSSVFGTGVINFLLSTIYRNTHSCLNNGNVNLSSSCSFLPCSCEKVIQLKRNS